MLLNVCGKPFSPSLLGSHVQVCGASKVLSWGTFHSHWVSRPHYQCIAQQSSADHDPGGSQQPWGCTPRELFCEAAGGEESPPACLGV